MLKISRNQIKKMILYLIIVIFVFCSDDSLIFGTNQNTVFVNIKYFLFAIVYIFLIIKNYSLKNTYNKKDFIYLITFVLVIICSMLFNADFRFGYIQKVLVIVASYIFCKRYSLQTFSAIFNKIMSFVTVFSLVYEAAYILLPQLSKIFILTNIGGQRFYTWLVCSLPIEPGGIIRNFGFAREPGVFAIYIIIALIFETFINENSSVKRIIIFTISLITTFSTTGFIAFGFYLIAILFNSSNTKNKAGLNQNIKIMLLLVIFVVFFVSFNNDFLSGGAYGAIFGKMNSDNISFNSRVASLISNTNIGCKNILVGKGLSYVELNFSVITKELLGISLIHNANTWFIHFAQFGLILFLTQFVLLYRTMKNLFKSKLLVILCMIIYIVVCMGQSMCMSPIFYIMLFLRNERLGYE